MYTVVFPKEGQVTRHASFLRYLSRSRINSFWGRMPRIFQSYLTSRLALQLSFGFPLENYGITVCTKIPRVFSYMTSLSIRRESIPRPVRGNIHALIVTYAGDTERQ
jgi:hypothetical protein